MTAGISLIQEKPALIERRYTSRSEERVKRVSLAIFLVLTAAPVLAQNSKESLASLIEAGNRKAALDRIRAGADVNAAQPDGTRPIHWAIYHVDYELVEALIAKKANVNVRNEFGS